MCFRLFPLFIDRVWREVALRMGIRKALTVLGMVAFSWLLVVGAVYVAARLWHLVSAVL